MALLNETERARTAAQWMRENLITGNFSKSSLRAAVDSTDQWIEDNTASYVTSLPTEFRTGSNAVQKMWLFTYVLLRRIGKLRAEEDG